MESESPMGTPPLGDEGLDESNLTIRIPNPSMYMARQSQWKGRRGKPRCDHCRLNNLKCDRVLPTCNHCSWVNRDCKYTPLPTPAHRGIPRCDRCRHHNLKCDRNLPVCNHCTLDKTAECNYTPKKRHKLPADKERLKPEPLPHAPPGHHHGYPGHPQAGGSRASFLVNAGSKVPANVYDFSSGSDDDDSDRERSKHSHKRAKYEHSWSMGDPSSSTVHAGPSGSAPPHSGSHPHGVHNSHNNHNHNSHNHNPPPVGSRPSFYDANLLPNNRHIEPWYHSKFAPLPRAVLQGIRTINPLEMPIRAAYDEALVQFLKDLPPDVAEVSAFAPEAYAGLAKCVSKGDENAVSPTVRDWTSIHHARSGSRKYNLVLLPKEEYYAISEEREDKLRNEFMAEVDGEAFPARSLSSGSIKPPAAPSTPGSAGGGSVVPAPKEKEKEREREGLGAFLRIPVLPQIYDVLVYAHKKHGSSTATLTQAREGGLATITWPMVELFCRLCPHCAAKARAALTATPQ